MRQKLKVLLRIVKKTALNPLTSPKNKNLAKKAAKHLSMLLKG